MQVKRFRTMLEMRYFDEACMEGVPTMEIHGELHTGIGQEAISAGLYGKITKEDALVSTHRNHYHALVKGVDPYMLMAEIFEKKSGLCKGFGGHMHPFSMEHNFSATGIVGQSLPVALGYAYAFKSRKQNNVAIGITGDGGANHGTFHEALNIAGAWKLPLLVLVENNGYGISVPISKVLSTQTIAERCSAYSAWGQCIDGNDPDNVAEAFGKAIQHVKEGHGPAILEAVCSRFRGHYEGDTDHYRNTDEKKAMLENDPIESYGKKLVSSKIVTEAEIEVMKVNSRQKMQRLLEKVRNEEMPPAKEALNYIFCERSS